MTTDFTFSISTGRFHEEYSPSAGSRITTNFANLARGEGRRRNLRDVLRMIDDRCNDLADEDNPSRNRYAVELDIVSVHVHLDPDGDGMGAPLIEMLDVTIVDTTTGVRLPGITGNNFSSHLRDYDFSVLLPRHNADSSQFGIPRDFGVLHGTLFRRLIESAAYRERFAQPPVICISVSTSQSYRRTGVTHPVLGVEYRQSEYSMTDRYFGKMGMQVRYFMPRGAAAPLAFYFTGDLLGDYADLALIGTISTMETFQKIYRPEIYNADAAAGDVYRPSLENSDFSNTGIAYDREERTQLGLKQGRFAEERFIRPNRARLDRLAAGHAPRPVAEAEVAR
ncbi:MAG: putative oxygenase MesX [Pseudoclavibacter sp.]